MSTMVFVNFPVSDLEKSTEFYTQLGFTINTVFSDENASCMVWDDNFYIMLLKHDFYTKFLKDKTIADTQKTSAALIAMVLDSADDVKKFAETAKANGGTYHMFNNGVPEDQMYGLEVQDLDGNTLEPVWMAM